MSGNARNEHVDIPAIAEKIVSSRAPGPLPRCGDRVHRRPVAVAPTAGCRRRRKA
jgi:hypothetical protein